MTKRQFDKQSCAILTSIVLLQPFSLMAQEAPGDVVVGPASSAMVKSFTTDITKEPTLTTAQKVALLQKRVKYVFVLFQENRSFDFYFGTFPGANGLFTKPAAQTPGFVQPILETNGTIGTVSPFLIPQTVTAPSPSGTGTITVPIYPADTSSVDHSHSGILTSSDFVNGVSLNDRFALDQQGLTTVNGVVVSKTTLQPPTTPATLAQKQSAELVMGHVDCDTAPFLWQLADRFTLFDNFHMTVSGPSTPNAIALIAGQSGLTQWALNPSEASNNTASPTVAASGGEPIVADAATFPGSNLDTSPIKPNINPGDENPNKPYLNQTYASLPCPSSARASRQPSPATRTRRSTCSTSRRTSRPSPATATRPPTGAGSKKATTPSRPTPKRSRCTAPMCGTTTARSISATSVTTPSSLATCTA